MTQPTCTAESKASSIDALLERCLGSVELVQRVVTLFADDFSGHVEEMQRLIADEEWEQVARLAHRMQGASANVGAESLTVELRQLSEAAHVREVDTCHKAWNRALEIWKQYPEETERALQDLAG